MNKNLLSKGNIKLQILL